MSEEKKKKLTPKQRKFVKEYQKDLNGTQAAIRAGYSEKSAQEIASENLSKPIIKEAVTKELDKTLEKLGIDAEYILNTIKRTIERCEIEEKYEPNAILKGAELLGKYKNLKIFTDKVEHSGDQENPIKVVSVELKDRVKQLKGEK